MNRLVLAAVLVGCCLAMPQRQHAASKQNPFVKILEYESFQDGANFGHALQQEDGTATGQKVGSDGLVYGFYSYIQDTGEPAKVYYRAGQGIGYEVLKVEGIDPRGLVHAKAPASDPAPQAIALPTHSQVKQPTLAIHQAIRKTLPVQHQPAPRPIARQPVAHRQQPAVRQPVVHRQQPVVPQQHIQPLPVVQQHTPVARQHLPVHPQVNALVRQEPTPAPHRFDYAAKLNLQRTGSGFRSSFTAL